ncbi:MAG TPA: tetratricopeptide repeat protein [Casimicrobiaceae bacterium]|nr:tetratricopeptide repeat protein [Casimicrobiaceae bacterium]
MFDAYGREAFIQKEHWRTSVLPGALKANWDNAQVLYNLIVDALGLGFSADVAEAAEHLHKTDPMPERGVCIHGIVLMKNGRLDDAEHVLRDYMKEHGEAGVLLTNVAKVYMERGQEEEADRLLWHALEVDPNQDNELRLYVARIRERRGEPAAKEAMRQIAAIPKSWLAQLWLAREALQIGDKKRALDLYGEMLDRAPTPVPTDALMQVSGDLGNAGMLAELVELTEPRFIVEAHGLPVGNNLIKAHVDLGHLERARVILEKLHAQRRPDWKDVLSFWDTAIAKARVASTPTPSAPLSVSMRLFDGPIWMKPSSLVSKLVPSKPETAPLVCILGSSAEVLDAGDKPHLQMPNVAGRLSRALPLFLTEQIELTTTARAWTMIPRIDGVGFVLGGVAWPIEDASVHARESTKANAYVVNIHLKTRNEPWVAQLRLIRAADATCLAEIDLSFPSATPETMLLELALRTRRLLAEHAEVGGQSVPPFYHPPEGSGLGGYVARLEQLLAVRCSGDEPNSLHGERDILDSNVQLCVGNPQSVVARLLLAQTLLAMKQVRSDVVAEFRTRVTQLQKNYPILGREHSLVQQIIDTAFQP